MKQPKIAIATEFLEQQGGAQKVLEAISELFPEAPIYTAKYNKKALSPILKNKEIIYPKGKIINTLAKHLFMFAMGPIFENYNFNDFDIVISDGTTWTKGIITKPTQLHITYVHTPPRFLYGYSREGTKWDKGLFKIPLSYILNILRMWDYIAAQRPDFIITNSKEVQKRVKRFYSKDSTVIYPPAQTEYKTKAIKTKFKDYYLAIGRFSSYKNFDKIIKAFNETDLNLVVVGTGLEEKHLKKLAGKNIEFVGRVSDEEKHYLLDNCKGIINAVEDEDFGIVPVEAHIHGKPVLGHKSGGHLETINDTNGMLFDNLTKDVVLEFNKEVNNKKFAPDKIKKTSQKYSEDRFKKEFKDFVDTKWAQFVKNNA